MGSEKLAAVIKLSNSNLEYEPLLKVLTGYWRRPFSRLPKRLKERVEKDFIPIKWGMTNEEGRKNLAAQIDSQHDPRLAAEQEFWFNFYNEKRELEEELNQLERMNAHSPSDIEAKIRLVQELKKKLAHYQRTEHRRLKGSNPKKYYREVPDQEYIPFLKAKGILSKKLKATPHEIAAWMVFGDNLLYAYQSPMETIPPPRYTFRTVESAEGYFEALHRCWFGTVELDLFQPDDRYVLGAELLERWKIPTEDSARAFIAARVSESRLQDLHPISGICQVTAPELDYLPSLEEALFPLSEVEAIEANDLEVASETSATPNLNTKEWHHQNARKAAEARHNQSGGSREKRDKIRAIWASGKYSSRNICAEEECAALGMAHTTARKALIGTPEPSRKG